MIRTLFLAIAQRCLKLALDESLRHALPKIYARLDIELPYWFKQRQPPAPSQVLNVIASATADGIGRTPTPSELALVRLLYDPVLAAKNLVVLRRPQP